MSGELTGLLIYAMSVLAMGGVYAVLALGLNLQWGFTGLFNAGIAGFFAVGAYAAAILTSPAHPGFIGGLGLPIPVGLIVAMALSGLVALGIGRLTLTLRSDYLAIATIGIAEIIRLIVKNEDWLTNGPRGIPGVPRPLDDPVWLVDGLDALGLGTDPRLVSELGYVVLVAIMLLVIYLALERAINSPWGRVMRAIRENEDAARAAGKNIMRLRLEAFVLGAMIMGLGGALAAHYIKFISPEMTEPLTATFLVWVMLIAGGSGNNRGAILGPLIIWFVWSATELATRELPDEWSYRSAYVRVFLIGLMLQIILQRFSGGLLAEKPPKPIPVDESEPTAPEGVERRPAE